VLSETLHELKCESRFFVEVLDGSKTFEVRKNDRCFQKGDRVKLRELASPRIGGVENNGYTGRSLDFAIGFVYPLDDGRVVFSLVKDRMGQ
jgi:hypothetical protein